MKNSFFIFIYLGIFCLILSLLSLFDVTDYIRSNYQYFNQIKQDYFFTFILSLIISSILLPFLGFALPIIILNGILLDDLMCFFVTLFGITIGSFIFYKIFFKKKFNNQIEFYLKKISFFSSKFESNQFLYFFLLRFVGFGLPFVIHNATGVFFKIRQAPFFFGTLFGVLPLALQSVLADSIFQLFLENRLNFNSLISDYRVIFVLISLFLIFIFYVLITRNIKKKKFK